MAEGITQSVVFVAEHKGLGVCRRFCGLRRDQEVVDRLGILTTDTFKLRMSGLRLPSFFLLFESDILVSTGMQLLNCCGRCLGLAGLKNAAPANHWLGLLLGLRVRVRDIVLFRLVGGTNETILESLWVVGSSVYLSVRVLKVH